MTVGVFRGGKIHTDIAHQLTPWLSGQRCLSAELFFSVDEHRARGYGVETAISLTASRHKWHRKYLSLRGVWHPTSETHRGIWHGLQVRSGMYTDILRTLIVDRFGKLSLLKLSWKHLFLAVFLPLIGFGLVYNRSMAASWLHPTDLPVLMLSHFQRVLVIAPHPDDEALGSGGVIQAALANGSEVRVVIVTNGDGQALGPLALRGKLLPHPIDYVVDGEVRQAESLDALGVLGLSPDAVVFLGYPDHQLNKLWMDDWKAQCPLRAKYTRDYRSSYPRTYDRQAVYCGIDILYDLRVIITRFKPNLVILPHPNDENLDHRATGNFGRMAIAQAMEADPGYQPQVFGYLVHYGFYPQPRGYRANEEMLPPIPLSGPEFNWERFNLTLDQVQKKRLSIQEYKTQLLLLRNFLPSFVRQDEIFVHLSTINPQILETNEISSSVPRVFKSSLLPEPKDESARRLVIKSADLTGLQVEEYGDTILLSAHTHGSLLKGLNYQMIVKLPDGQTQIASWPGSAIRTGPNSFAYKVNISEFTEPIVLGYSAQVTQGTTLDRSSWQFIILRNHNSP